MEDDLVNSAAAKGWSLGQAADRLCDKQRALALAGRVSNESQTCAAFRDERVAVGQERETERVREPSRDHHNADLVLLGRVEGVRLAADHNWSNPDLRLTLLGEHDRG
jgi:hypothetical protein